MNTCREVKAIQQAGSEGLVTLPIPTEQEHKVLSGRGVKFGHQIDSVCLTALLPKGWKLRSTGIDCRHRWLFMDKDVAIAHVFLKSTPYDYYGLIRLL